MIKTKNSKCEIVELDTFISKSNLHQDGIINDRVVACYNAITVAN